MTVRLDSNLLLALKNRAQKVGRSVSAEVVQMIKQQITTKNTQSESIPKSEGMFSQFEAPTLEELRDLRKTYPLNPVPIDLFLIFWYYSLSWNSPGALVF